MNVTHHDSNHVHLTARDSLRSVRFYCAAPRARSVELTGDFTSWRPLRMQHLTDGWWFYQLELCHGHHLYRFLVDGEPVLDPQATGTARDERNEQASLIAVS